MNKEEFITKCINAINEYSLRLSVDVDYFTGKEVKATAYAINALTIIVQHLLESDVYLDKYIRHYSNYTEDVEFTLRNVRERVLTGIV